MFVKVTRYSCLFWILLFISSKCLCQATTLHITPVDKELAFFEKIIKPKVSFSSAAECYAYLNQLSNTLQAKGFISASLDSVWKEANTIHVNFYIGEQYTWKQLHVNKQDWSFLNMLGIKQETFEATPFNHEHLRSLQEKFFDYCERNGYPFAKLSFDSVQLQFNTIAAKLVIDKGIAYRMDSIRVFGNAKINKTFLYRYLGLAPKSLYNKEKLQAINQRLIELPYLQQVQPWRLNMLGNAYLVDLFLQPKRSNQIDAIVGFLPANQQLGGKLLFTVDAKLNLQNAFAAGESIALNWQQIQPQSPRLNIAFQKPYIFNSAFGFDFAFDLYKRDSAFLNLNSTIGVQYSISAKQKAKVLFQSFRTNLLDVDTNAVKATKQLPTIIDASINSLVFEYELNNTNYKFNPSKGNELKLSFSGGTKTIRQNNAISQIKDPSFNYSKLYDTVASNTYQLKARLSAAHYFAIGKNSVFKTSINGGIMQSPKIFRNEMFQIGGYKLLRGFDEESIFTNQFVVGTLEYRLLIDANSYFAVFSDVGQAANKIIGLNNTFIGGGFGLSFQTKQGIFNISYAAGKRNDLPFNLRESKIHLGFVSLF
jgi:outer membrane protein assembly factor BamA